MARMPNVRPESTTGFRQHPDSRRGMPGTVGQPQRKLYGSAAGVPSTTDTEIGEAAGGAAQAAAAAGGYSSTGGDAALFSSVAPIGSGSATTGQSSSAFAGAPTPTAQIGPGGGTGSGVPIIGTQASNTSGAAGPGQGFARNAPTRGIIDATAGLTTALPTAQTGNALPV